MYTNGETVGEQNTMAAIQTIASNIPEVELRDLFAMSAMNTIIHDHTVSNLDDILSEEYKGYYLKKIPEAAYKIADAMLVARRKK